MFNNIKILFIVPPRLTPIFALFRHSNPMKKITFFFAIRNLMIMTPLAISLSACEKVLAPSSSFEVARVGIYDASLLNQTALVEPSLKSSSSNGLHHFALIGSIYDGTSLWRLEDQERLFNWNHQDKGSGVLIASDFSPDGLWAISAQTHDMVLWNTQSGASERYWSAPSEILDVALAKQARFALLGLTDGNAIIFDIRKGGILHTFEHSNRVRSVDLSDDGSIALSGSEDFNAIAWDVKTGQTLFTQTHEDDVQLVKLSPDGSIALSVSKYDSAKLWKTATGELIGEIPLKAEYLKRGLRYTAAQFSQDNQWLLTGRPDQRVELWGVEDLKQKAKWKLPKRNYWKPTSAAVLDVSFSSKKSTFHAIASNGFIHTLTLQ